MKKARYHFNVVLRPEPEGGFTALVPALPGCVTYGRTLAEARAMAKDAVCGYIESLRKHGEPVPTDNETLVTSLDLEYAQTARRLTGRRRPVLGRGSANHFSCLNASPNLQQRCFSASTP